MKSLHPPEKIRHQFHGMIQHLCQFHEMSNSKLEERFCPVSAKQKNSNCPNLSCNRKQIATSELDGFIGTEMKFTCTKVLSETVLLKRRKAILIKLKSFNGRSVKKLNSFIRFEIADELMLG